ncbi:MAG: cytochrome B [Rhodobacterales bacterium]|nr:MAG: cytochrome B [Rhodobacterales bacterium]
MKTWHHAIVALHWLLALMIMAALAAGKLILAATPNSDPHKLDSLQAHMTLGLAIGALMLLRLVVRLFTENPAHAATGSRLLDLAGSAAHWGLYLLVFAMVASGVGISLGSGLPEILAGNGTLPADFAAYPPRAVHGIAATLLGLLILAHVAGAGYHTVVLKDGLMRRMWFGKRR